MFLKSNISQSGETGAQAVNKNHGETFPQKNTRREEEEMCCVSKFSRTVQGNIFMTFTHMHISNLLKAFDKLYGNAMITHK
jgi:hypothetical protein